MFLYYVLVSKNKIFVIFFQNVSGIIKILFSNSISEIPFYVINSRKIIFQNYLIIYEIDSFLKLYRVYKRQICECRKIFDIRIHPTHMTKQLLHHCFAILNLLSVFS